MRIRTKYRHGFSTGAVTTIAAGSATAGHIFAIRNRDSAITAILRAIEVEFTLTTAFTAAQRMGFHVHTARDYSAPHTGATALDLTGDGGKYVHDKAQSVLSGRIADTGALTAGTHILGTNPIAAGSAWMGAVGDQFTVRRYDFTTADDPTSGIAIGKDEGIVIQNSVTMGAGGVGTWHFTIEVVEVTD